MQLTADTSQNAVLSAIMERLIRLESTTTATRPDDVIRPAGSARPSLIDAASLILTRRRMRDRFFSAGLFGEPAFDLLLDLYVNGAKGRRVSVSSACIAAAVPATTALRWIMSLVERGLIERLPDPTDARRQYVRLSPDARQRIEAYLEECCAV